jgi:type I restriction enzyme, S subunit
MPISDTIFPTDLRSTVDKSMVAASRLEITQFRLDASTFLARDKFSALMPRTSQSQPLSELADVFTVYIQSPILAYVKPFAKSRPYMTTSELAEHLSPHTTHVSLLADPRLLEWEIKSGSVVVSRSGRVGEAYWVNKKLSGALVGDSFRVIPKNPVDGPFIYAVLASNFARNLLSGSAYGSVVDHASVDQLRTFPVPQLTGAVRSKIASVVSRAIALRDSAYDSLDDAQNQLLNANKLSQLSPSDSDPSSAHVDVTAFNVTFEDVVQSAASASEFRIEAHFHNPVARTAIARIERSPSSKRTIGELSRDVILCGRFKRNYVESEYGTPFLSGRNIVQVRPTDLNHLSNSETEDMQSSLLQRGWVLVTRSGTVGRTCFVWDNFENFAASEHILRVLPDEAEIDAGYLYAFLSSEYGYQQIIRFRYGSVIDEITDQQLKKVIVPVPSKARQREIGDLVRSAYEMRSKALSLEDEAQNILLREIEQRDDKERPRV